MNIIEESKKFVKSLDDDKLVENKNKLVTQKVIKHGGTFLENDSDIFYQCPTCLRYIEKITTLHNKCEYCNQLLKE